MSALALVDTEAALSGQSSTSTVSKEEVDEAVKRHLAQSGISNTKIPERTWLAALVHRLLRSPTVRIVVFGQVISLLLCGTGVASSYIAQDGVNVPTTQSFINYFLLAVIFIPVSIYRREFVPAFKARWWIYMLIAAVDVEANFAFVKAYQYTSLTSIQVLDCFTIPCVIILGRIFLKTPFPLKKLASVVVCLGGIACLITADVTTSRNDGPAGWISTTQRT